MAASPATLPPSVLALPEDIRAAMGEAWATEIVLAIERLAAEGRRMREENANELEIGPQKDRLSRSPSKRQGVGRPGVARSAA